MSTKNLFIPGGATFAVTEVVKEDGETQKFLVDLSDGHPERLIEYTRYDTWEQIGGLPMLDSHIEQLGKSIKLNFEELF